jgi:hypothetical protein
MNKLTNSEISRVFAMYHGQRCIIAAGEFKEQTLPVCGSLPNGKIICGDYSVRFVECVDCKLLLIPLEFITYKHAADIANLADPYNTLEIDYNAKRGKELIFEYIKSSRCNISGTDWWQIFQQLILWGYAVPLFFGPDHWANGKDAIELGLAIDKTKQPNGNA